MTYGCPTQPFKKCWGKRMLFPISGIEVNPLIPFGVAFIISFFTSMGGVSGAFLLLPFQMSVLGYVTPSVSGTNQVFNIVAIPSGVYRYIREGRMLWPLTWAVIVGTLPGVVLGAWVRIKYLPDPKNFKLFAGVVLFYIGFRLLMDIIKNKGNKKVINKFEQNQHTVRVLVSTFRMVEFDYDGETHHFSSPIVYLICFFGRYYRWDIRNRRRCHCRSIFCGNHWSSRACGGRCCIDGHIHHIRCWRVHLSIPIFNLYEYGRRTGLVIGSIIWNRRFFGDVFRCSDSEVRACQIH